MASIRLPTSVQAVGTDWIRVVVDGLQVYPENYYEINVYCTQNGILAGQQSGKINGGGTEGNYRTEILTFGGLSSGLQYEFYAVMKLTANSPDDITNTLAVSTLSSRPSDFAWTYYKNSGYEFNLYAFEWNNFFAKINEFREYKGLSTYSFTTAYSGFDFFAYMFNEAIYAISAMFPSYALPATVSSGTEVYAYQLNGLVSSLNSIT